MKSKVMYLNIHANQIVIDLKSQGSSRNISRRKDTSKTLSVEQKDQTTLQSHLSHNYFHNTMSSTSTFLSDTAHESCMTLPLSLAVTTPHHTTSQLQAKQTDMYHEDLVNGTEASSLHFYEYSSRL